MWQLIQLNKRRSIVLLLIMAFIMLLLGGIIGQAIGTFSANYQPEKMTAAVDRGDQNWLFNGMTDNLLENPWWLYGMAVAFALWLIQVLVAYYAGGDIMLSISGAIEVGPKDHQVLCNVVEEMTLAAGLSKQPRIFIIPDEAPNAFATGTKPENSAVAVTAGLLGRLRRDELQGVIAHEMSHILNRDIMFMTMVGIMLGTIVMLSDVFLRSTFYGSMRGSRYSSRNDRNNGGGAAVMLIIAILMAIIAPLLAQLIYFATSRKREYLADASAVRLTRNPEGLADALEKIATNSRPMPHANRVTAPLYINNPNASRSLDSLTSTHPPIAKRIAILRKLAGTDGSYRSYDKAYSSVNGGSCVPGAALVDDMPAAPVGNVARSAAAVSEPIDRVSQQRQTGDLIMTLNDYKILTCTCGLKLKIPPRFRHKKAQCPKCGKVHVLA